MNTIGKTKTAGTTPAGLYLCKRERRGSNQQVEYNPAWTPRPGSLSRQDRTDVLFGHDRDILLVFYTICWVCREYDPDHEDEPYRTCVQKSLSAIRDGTKAYVTLLNSPDYQVRAITAFVLPLLTKRDPRSMAATLSRLRVETDSEVIASLAWSLGDYADEKSPLSVQDRDKTRKPLRNLIDRGQVPQVRFSAARSLIEVEGSGVGSGVVDILLNAIGQPDLYSNLPGGAVPTWSATEALYKLSGNRRLRAFQTALDVVPTPGDAHLIAMAFLDCVLLGATSRVHHYISDYSDPELTRYGGEADEPLNIHSLSPEHREAVRIVLEADKVWEQPSNLLATYGLPTLRDEAHRLLTLVSGSGI